MAGTDARDEMMDSTPPPLAIIFRTHPAPHDAMSSTTAGLLCTSDDPRPPSAIEALGSSPFGTKAGNDVLDEPMDTTPPSTAVIFRSHPTPHGAVGSTNFGVRAGNDAQDEPMDTAPPSMAVTFQSPTALHGAVGSTTFCLRSGNYAQDEHMDTTHPSMAIIFRSTPSPTRGHGQQHFQPPAHLRHPPCGKSFSGPPWTHTMPW
ncbi:Serine/Threonine-Protein Phosphatase 4 Catalytic Subunit [Manis pentadactyla]|nr:Serine/Threonine-Protein Phosphatase 4 Catalytic Subunit [Manis pentadactyla]